MVMLSNMRLLLVLGQVHCVLLLSRHDLAVELLLLFGFVLVVGLNLPLELHHSDFGFLAIPALTFGPSQLQLLTEQLKRQVLVLHVHFINGFLYLNFLLKLLV